MSDNQLQQTVKVHKPNSSTTINRQVRLAEKHVTSAIKDGHLDSALLNSMSEEQFYFITDEAIITAIENGAIKNPAIITSLKAFTVIKSGVSFKEIQHINWTYQLGEFNQVKDTEELEWCTPRLYDDFVKKLAQEALVSIATITTADDFIYTLTTAASKSRDNQHPILKKHHLREPDVIEIIKKGLPNTDLIDKMGTYFIEFVTQPIILSAIENGTINPTVLLRMSPEQLKIINNKGVIQAIIDKHLPLAALAKMNPEKLQFITSDNAINAIKKGAPFEAVILMEDQDQLSMLDQPKIIKLVNAGILKASTITKIDNRKLNYITAPKFVNAARFDAIKLEEFASLSNENLEHLTTSDQAFPALVSGVKKRAFEIKDLTGLGDHKFSLIVQGHVVNAISAKVTKMSALTTMDVASLMAAVRIDMLEPPTQEAYKQKIKS
jgi:hypothetical protein